MQKSPDFCLVNLIVDKVGLRLINKFCLLLISVMLAVFTVGCGVLGGSETVKIGLLSPQTGPIAQYAPGFEDAG